MATSIPGMVTYQPFPCEMGSFSRYHGAGLKLGARQERREEARPSPGWLRGLEGGRAHVL